MVHNNRFIILLILIFFLALIKNSYSSNFTVEDQIEPYCNGVGPDNFLQDIKIDNIEIRAHKSKEWIKNLLGALVEFNSKDSKTHNEGIFNFRIANKYKKRFKSLVIVNFKEKDLSCIFEAKIRITGDGHWHIGWKGGDPISSIQVQLTNGHINSITRFKLLLPVSRGGNRGAADNKGAENEIFVTSFLRELGFLAPRTYLISSKINGVSGKYIFQEDLGKEFLENAQLIEGPILEGDERFTVMKKEQYMIPGLALSRLSNKKFSLKGDTNGKIALSAVSNLNLVYLQNHQILSPFVLDILHINTEKFFLDKSNKERFQTYESLIYALGATHAQSGDDRRFYFDPINKYYIPIYYDGKADIFNNKNTELDEDEYFQSTFPDAKKGALKAIALINNIDHDIFFKELMNSGLDLSIKKYKNLIQRIKYRLNLINSAKPLEVKFLKTGKYFSNLSNSISKDKKLVFVDFDKKEFHICNFSLEECRVKKKMGAEFRNLLGDIISQRYKDPDNLSDLNYLFVYSDKDYDKEKNLKKKLFKTVKINDNSTLKYNSKIQIKIFPEKKQIYIDQLSNEGRAVISGKMLDNWIINFNGADKEINPNIPNDYMGLNGCLTLIDIKVENLKIFSKNSTCEDSINFIRVAGDISELNILNSTSDAADFDFSNLTIDNVNIKSAKNDCLDLSYGNYEINKIEAIDCGDKGISVGEKSKALIKVVKIDKSSIAIAVKDSSVANIESSKIDNSPICFTAYRKKPEFAGGKINISKTNCKTEQFFAQEGSKIISNL